MKLRIQYIYENGGNNMLQLLLSSEGLSDFLNQANNIASLSTYDREMLKKYENTQKSIETQETQIKEEAASIGTLMSEKSSKQQEVQTLVASTNDSISSYVSQISASQAEADALMAEVSSADSSISQLMEQAEAERAAAEEAAAQEAAQAEESSSDEEYDTEESDESCDDSQDGSDEAGDSSEEDSEDTSSDDGSYSKDTSEDSEDTEDTSSDESSDDTTADSSEDSEAADDSGSDSSDSDASSSSQGKYLGNFMLTAYCNCAQCCGTAGNATASGVMPTAGHTVAMAGVPFGTQLLINGTVYTVEDLGTPYGHVDIYCGSHSEALSFGLQYADVYQLN